MGNQEGFELHEQKIYIKKKLEDDIATREALFKAYNVDTIEKFVEKYGFWDIVEFVYGIKVNFNNNHILNKEEEHAYNSTWYDIVLSVYKDEVQRKYFMEAYLGEENDFEEWHLEEYYLD